MRLSCTGDRRGEAQLYRRKLVRVLTGDSFAWKDVRDHGTIRERFLFEWAGTRSDQVVGG